MSTTEVSPKEITKSVERGKEYEETLTVRNVGDERTSYDVRPDEIYRAWVDPDPNHFAINASESRDIILQLRVPNDARRGTNEFNISVVNDDNPDDTAEIHVALRVPIPALWWILITILLLLLVLIIVALLSQRQSGGAEVSAGLAGLLWLWGQVVLA